MSETREQQARELAKSLNGHCMTGHNPDAPIEKVCYCGQRFIGLQAMADHTHAEKLKTLAHALAACALESRLQALEEARQVAIVEREAWKEMDRFLAADAADNCEIGIRALIVETNVLERAAGEGKS